MRRRHIVVHCLFRISSSSRAFTRGRRGRGHLWRDQREKASPAILSRQNLVRGVENGHAVRTLVFFVQKRENLWRTRQRVSFRFQSDVKFRGNASKPAKKVRASAGHGTHDSATHGPFFRRTCEQCWRPKLRIGQTGSAWTDGMPLTTWAMKFRHNLPEICMNGIPVFETFFLCFGIRHDDIIRGNHHVEWTVRPQARCDTTEDVENSDKQQSQRRNSRVLCFCITNMASFLRGFHRAWLHVAA